MRVCRALVEEGGLDPCDKTTKSRLVRERQLQPLPLFLSLFFFLSSFLPSRACGTDFNQTCGECAFARRGFQTPLDLVKAAKSPDPQLLHFLKNAQLRREGGGGGARVEEDSGVSCCRHAVNTLVVPCSSAASTVQRALAMTILLARKVTCFYSGGTSAVRFALSPVFGADVSPLC